MPDLPPAETPTAPLAAGDIIRLPSAAAALAPRFHLEREIGRGGMGVVYLARDTRLDRPVAIKVLLGGWFAGADQRQRLRAEAVTVARLDHPNIVRLYEVGEFEDIPYLVLEYVNGETLRQRVLREPFTPQQAAAVVAALAGAAHHAHSHGVIHRDLKPQNVLLPNGAGDPPEPKLTDFGIAKRLDGGAEETTTGVLLGTPAYMAPEQAAGRREAIGPWTDVYALGAILYELLAGRPPFRDDAPASTVFPSLLHTPPPPRAIRPTTPPELEAICLKCLEKSPDRRYQTATQLAEDLGRWARGEVPTARPPGRLAQAVRRLVPSRRLAVTAVGLVFVAATTAFATLLAGGRPTLDPQTDPREQNERQLAAGQAVTLIGETGLPQWSRWAIGVTPLTTSATYLDDTASFPGRDVSLLELLTDPMTDRYRLTAEMRDDTPSAPFSDDLLDDEKSIVGVFLGYRHVHIPDVGEVHRFLGVSFADRMLPEDVQPNRPHRHRARFELRGVQRGVQEGRYGWQAYTLESVRFDPADRRSRLPRPWRTIRVDVSADGVEAYWGGGGESQSFGRWTAAKLDQRYRHWPPIAFPAAAGTPRPGVLGWVPRSPLGVFASGTPVSVRNVVVTPLPEP